jgi:prepilin-type N-terminal cleavage/methylation domain-containing protein
MRRRSGFTLVEVLVSMALILFIMSILAAAFGAASQAVSDLKSAGDLAEKLRGATNVLKRDLECPHFFDGKNGTNSIRLSDVGFWGRLPTPADPTKPPVGFFRIFQQQADAADVAGGHDLDNIPSFHQTTTALHYTIALQGTRRSDFLSAALPPASPLTTASPSPPSPSPNDVLLGQGGLQPTTDERYQDTPNVYNSQYAEVAVFLAPTNDFTDGTGGITPQPLFALYRRQFLTVPPGWGPPTPAQQVPAGMAAQYLEVSTIPTAGEASAAPNLTFNTMQDLTMPVKRFWMNRGVLAGTFLPGAASGEYAMMGESNPGLQSADLLMTDVLSFDVRVLVQAGNLKGAEFEDLFQLTDHTTPRTIPGSSPPIPWYFSPNNSPAGNNSVFSAMGVRVFDTWTNQTDPNQPTYDYSQWQTPGGPSSIPMFNDNFGNPISIQAIQITLRVWDFKTKKTRQVTIVQQM